MEISILKPLQRWLSASVRRSESLETSWASALQQAIADLKTLNGATERDFLAVGGRLMEFRAASSGISSDMTALIDLISGEGGQDRALACMLDDSTQREARIRQSGEALERVKDSSRQILLAFSQLRQTVSTFRTLCTLTRIESSRLGSASAAFGNLASEVKPLSESIEASGEVIFAAYMRLEESIDFALRRCARLQSRQQEELPPLVAGVIDALGALEERRELAYRTSVDQVAQYRAMGDAIGKLVTSLQIHDITRQQIEHVASALEQLLPKVPGPLPRSATPVLALQGHQLWSASQVFEESVGEIERDLNDIAARAQEMAEASRKLLEASGDERNSFVERMEGYFKAIGEAAAAFDKEWLDMRAIAAGLEETIERMRAAIADIRRIEIQIQRIAVNAAIGAIHVGSSGQAISVIAEVMQSLAQESNDNTECAAAALDEMSHALRRASGSEAGDGNDALGVTKTAIEDLRSSAGGGYGRVGQIAAAETQLSNAIGALRSGFSAGALFREVVQRVRGDLDRMVEEAFPEISAEHQAAHTQELESLAKRYTMQRERDVHESLVNGPAPEPATPEVQTAVLRVAGDEEDLGENVELF